MDELLTTKEVTELFKVTRQTLYTWRKRGLPYVRLTTNSVRYPRKKIEAWIAGKGRNYG